MEGIDLKMRCTPDTMTSGKELSMVPLNIAGDEIHGESVNQFLEIVASSVPILTMNNVDSLLSPNAKLEGFQILPLNYGQTVAGGATL